MNMEPESIGSCLICGGSYNLLKDQFFKRFCDNCFEIHCQEYMKSIHKKFSSCDVCLSTFISGEQQVKHDCFRSNIFVCENCGKSFSKKTFLKCHVVRSHTSRVCLLCLKSRSNFRKDKLFKRICDCCYVKRYKHAKRGFLDKKFRSCATCSETLSVGSQQVRHDCSRLRVFVCDVCNKVFSRKPLLKLHMMRKHFPSNCLLCERKVSKAGVKICSHIGVFSCEHCDRTFYHKSQIEQHIENRFTKHSCSSCQISFCNESDFKTHNTAMHSSQVDAQTFKCCEKTFDKPSVLQRHVKAREKAGRCICKFCNKSFFDASTLRSHLNKHTKEKIYTCQVCSKSFLRKSSLKSHENLHTKENKYICKVCNGTFYQKAYFKVHMNLHSMEKNFTCNFCDKVFYRPSTFYKHINNHTKDRKFPCNFCDKVYLQPYYLTRHINIHDRHKTYKCRFCSEIFSDWFDWKEHIINTHPMEKIFPCKLCDKFFLDDCGLDAHFRTHLSGSTKNTTVNKPVRKSKTYTCKLCKVAFTSGLELKQHTAAAHKKENIFVCEFCGKRFSQLNGLTRHTNLHTKEKQYPCTFCDKVFLRSSYLRCHVNLHTKAKTYMCEFCSKTFLRLFDFKEHINLHTKERKYVCKLCNRIFYRKFYLDKHLRKSLCTKKNSVLLLVNHDEQNRQ